MDDLLHLAQRMMLRAHAPYSKFHVGAAVRGEDGSIHGGCNVENAAYPQGLCAEASAIAALVAAGHKRAGRRLGTHTLRGGRILDVSAAIDRAVLRSGE